MKKLFTIFAILFLAIVFGQNSFAQIYTQDFTTTFPPTGWALVNAGSGNNWSLNSSATYAYNGSYSMQYLYTGNAANAWAFTQGVSMTAGKTYRLEFYQRVRSASYAEKMKVTVGTNQTVAGVTNTLLDLTSLTNTTFTNRVSSEYTCSTTGTYYFGLNCYSIANQWNLYVDNIRIYETTVSSPPNPATIVSPANTGTNIATNQTLNWASGGGSPTGYRLYFGTSPVPPLVGDLGNVTTYTPTLAFGTTYYWQIIPYNAYGDATGCPVWSFTTISPIAPPLTENFDGVTAPSLPAGWTIEDANADTYKWANMTGYPNTSPNAIGYTWWVSTAMNDWFFTRPLTLTAGKTYAVSFNYKNQYSGYTNKLEIKYGTTQTSAGMTSAAIYDNSSITSTSYAQGLTSFTVPSTGTYYIGFHGYSAAYNYYLFVDDFSITETINNPGSFSATPSSSSQIDLSFTPDGSNNVVIVWNNTGTFTTPSGAPPSVGSAFAGGTLLYNGLTSPVNHTPLTSGTTYYYKAFSYDGSAYSTGLTANAIPPCNTISSFPYTEGYEGLVTANTLPPCMSSSPTVAAFGKTQTYIASATGTNSALIARTGSKFSAVYYSPNAAGWFFSAPLQLTGGVSYTTSVYYKTDGVAWPSAGLSYGSTPSIAGMTNSITTITNAAATTYTLITGTFTPSSTGTYYVGYFADNTSTNAPNYMSFDDFSIDLTPTNPVFSITPTLNDFGSVGYGSTSTQLFTISNTGGGTINIASVVLSGTDATQFSLTDANTYPKSLTAGQSMTLSANFTPTTAGSKTAKFTVTHDASGSPVDVNLSGVGVNYHYGGGALVNGSYFFANSTTWSNANTSKPTVSWIDPVASSHTKITTWTSAGTGDDDYFTVPDIGFDFMYFVTNTYRTANVFISSNGYIAFGTAPSTTDYGHSIPGTGTAQHNVIAGCWNDLNMNSTTYPNTSVYYGGDANQFVVTWIQAHPFGVAGEYLTFQIILSPKAGENGDIKIQYDFSQSTPSITTLETEAFIGIENSDGTKGIGYRNASVGGPFFDNTLANGPKATGSLALQQGMSNGALPVNLQSFNSKVETRDITLTWVTSKEENNAGFDVERKLLGTNDWSKISFVQGKGNTNNLSTYNFLDRKLGSGKYNYRLKQVDYNGNYRYYTLANSVEVGIPTKFNISQNYPNPFNPTTKIDFDLPFDSKVNIILYDMTGREMKTLVNEGKTAGYHTVQFNASGLSSGTYFYRIITKSAGKDFVATKKMVLIK